jgi:hypothetical protein
MKIRFSKAPTFTKAIIAAAVFAIVYLASSSNLPSCSDTAAVFASGGECIERQSFLHTASGWLALLCLVAAAVLLVLKYKDSILGGQASAPKGSTVRESAVQESAGQEPSGQEPAPVPGRASGFCATCGTRIIAGDRFCQGCGAPMGSQ